jgi:hypothetical protein
MITDKQLSQGVSIIPVLVSVIVLILGGSWFIAYETYTYTASDDIIDGLVKNSDYNFYLDEVENSQYDGVDKTGNREDTIISYSDSGYEQRGIVFYNMSLIVYAISFIAFLSSILIFVRDYDLIPNISKVEFSAVTFGSYIAIFIFLLFLASYSVMAIPDAVHEDHMGTNKSCIYDDDMFIAGVDNCDVHFTNDPQIDVISQKTTWSIGLGFIIFIVGMLIPSIFLITSTLQRLGDDEEELVPEPVLYFDPEARLLFDINTGEVVGSFAEDDREFFFDEDAMILFDEDTGDIVYSAGIISPTIPEAEPVETESVEAESVAEPVETESVAEPVETESVEAESVAEPVETESVAEPVEAEPVETESVETESVEAEPVEAEVVEAEPVDAEVVEGEPVDSKK